MVIELPQRYEQNVSVFQNDLGFAHSNEYYFFFYQMSVESRAVRGLPIWRSLRDTKHILHNTAYQMQVQKIQDVCAAAQGSGMVYLGSFPSRVVPSWTALENLEVSSCNISEYLCQD